MYGKVLVLKETYSQTLHKSLYLKPYSSKFNLGENLTELRKYIVQYSGIQQNEKIKSGEVRKITTRFRTISESNDVLFDEAITIEFI